MSATLNEWQDKMKQHFSALAEQRAARGLPVFGLEHGLKISDFEDIATKLRLSLSTEREFVSYWLLWTIYASEQGYTYKGKYWPSFENSTPSWQSRDRDLVREWFLKFHKNYNGFVPSGPWADKFGIISYPVTHAILPLTFQYKFARTLYDLSRMFLELTNIDPAIIGHMIADNAHYTTSSFGQFLQQKELVGHIVFTMFNENPPEGEGPLLPATLRRIVKDIRKVHEGRDWLRRNHRAVADRFKGIAQGYGPRSSEHEASPGGQRKRRLKFNIRPSLRLRRIGKNYWGLVIDVPSFKEIAVLNVEVRQFLGQTRCILNGDPSKKPPGWLLSGRQRAVLKEWPDPTKALVSFDKTNTIIENIFGNECRIHEGPVWLFRVGRDSTAQEIASRVVHPGREYILISRDAFGDLLDGMYPCTVDCKEIKAIRILVPDSDMTDSVFDEYKNWLKRQNLELLRTIRVWPAGLPGRYWDGEGHSEWLTTEKPCLGIIADHPVDSLRVTLNNEFEKTIHGRSVKQPAFIQLPQLETGKYILRVEADRSASLDGFGTREPLKGWLELYVREPKPRTSGTILHTGLMVISDPHDASLDVFWKNELKLTVFGLANRQITPFVTLKDIKGQKIFDKQICGPIKLPVKPEIWRNRFRNFLDREKCHWHYLDASSGTLTINGEDLGQFDLNFSHLLLPFRWTIHHQKDSIRVCLVDETGQEKINTKCWLYSMKTPTYPTHLDNQKATEGIEVTPAGELFIAQKSEELSDAIIISSDVTGAGFGGLGVKHDFGYITRNPDSIIELLKILRYWKTARAEDVLAQARRQDVVTGMHIEICGAIVGQSWARAERKFRDEKGSSSTLERLQQLLGTNDGFAVTIQREAAKTEQNRKSISHWYADRARQYKICSDTSLCSFAIDFVCRPHQLLHLYPKNIYSSLRHLMRKRRVLRGARFAAMNCVRLNRDDIQTLLPRWN